MYVLLYIDVNKYARFLMFLLRKTEFVCPPPLPSSPHPRHCWCKITNKQDGSQSFSVFFYYYFILLISLSHSHGHRHANEAHTHANRSVLHLYCSLSLRTFKLYDAAETIQSRTRASVFPIFVTNNPTNSIRKRLNVQQCFWWFGV